VIIVNKDAEALIKTRFKCTAKKYTSCILLYSLKMLGCQMWTDPNVGLKMVIKKMNPMAGFVHI